MYVIAIIPKPGKPFVIAILPEWLQTPQNASVLFDNRGLNRLRVVCCHLLTFALCITDETWNITKKTKKKCYVVRTA